MDLREDLDLTYLFISHDLSVVEHIADRVVIMYLGRVVEIAATADIFAAANHPYTQALLSEVPRIDLRKRSYHPVKGEIRSEEHTSELQSLMRISYAVFCLKKKKKRLITARNQQ